MNIILLILLVVVAIIFHEFGHLIEMQKLGLRVKKFSIGFPIKGIPSFSFSVKRFPGVVFEFNPLPLGGFVSLDEEGKQMNDLSYKDSCFALGGGIMGSLVFIPCAFILGLMVSLSIGEALNYELLLVHTIILTGMCVILIIVRNFVYQFVFPVLTVVATIIFTWVLMGSSGDSLGGPATIVATAREQADNIMKVFILSAFLSFNLALFNLLPIFPLDGGQIIKALMKKMKLPDSVINIYCLAGVFFLILITVLALKNDARILFWNQET